MLFKNLKEKLKQIKITVLNYKKKGLKMNNKKLLNLKIY